MSDGYRRSPFSVQLPEDLEDSQVRRRPKAIDDILYMPRTRRPAKREEEDKEQDASAA